MFREIPLNVHLLEFAGVTGDFGSVTGIDPIAGGAGRPLSRLMLRTVLESLDANPALMPLTVHRLRRRLLPGERPDRGRACAAHDRGVLVVAQRPGGCGIEVEDADSRLLADVAYRFCVPGDSSGSAGADGAGAGAGPGELWAVRESTARSLRLGPAADLPTIIADPAAYRTPSAWRGAPPRRIATVVSAGGRHLALIMAADQSPRLMERCWGSARNGARNHVRCHAA